HEPAPRGAARGRPRRFSTGRQHDLVPPHGRSRPRGLSPDPDARSLSDRRTRPPRRRKDGRTMADIREVTEATFEELVINSQRPVLVDFWAAWCGPCKLVAPEMQKIADKYA